MLGRSGMAADIVFPTTESEISTALGLGWEGQAHGVGAVQGPKVRGLGAIVDTRSAPAVGALVLFDTDSDRVKAGSFQLLDSFAAAFRHGPPSATILVSGHTDHTGTDAHNDELSRKRAASVRDYLIGKGVRTAALRVVGYGKSRPIASNETEVGRARNRRVEFVRVE
jgi:outer membrane protein OmpA-like peptidoglycan-associated protein